MNTHYLFKYDNDKNYDDEYNKAERVQSQKIDDEYNKAERVQSQK